MTVIYWMRRDLRLEDNPALERAVEAGGPVVPVFIQDDVVSEQYGAAPLWRLGESLSVLGREIESLHSRLILRKGPALESLRALIRETGARQVVWSRLYDPRSIDRDRKIKAALSEDGIEVVSVNGSLLFEPWTVETKTGGPYKVYTPFWRAVRGRDVREPIAVPGRIPAPDAWPASDTLADWQLGRAMNRGAEVVRPHAAIGAAAARDRLEAFLDGPIGDYARERDRTDRAGTSKLAENLTYGEISPVTIWHAGRRAMEEATGTAEEGAETFLKELVWREFSYHLIFHTPRLATRNWREEWDDFPWRRDNAEAERWRRGMTGIEMVDAGMREMYVTGTMHNRVRMLTASFLTKHLLTDWRVGEAWFRDCLIDWDVAANAMGWQWAAGSGPDAAPYFRVFNPDTQAEKFDPDCNYRNRFLAEGRKNPHEDAMSFYDAVPRSWGISPDDDYPQPVIGLKEGRERALAAYEKSRKNG